MIWSPSVTFATSDGPYALFGTLVTFKHEDCLAYLNVSLFKRNLTRIILSIPVTRLLGRLDTSLTVFQEICLALLISIILIWYLYRVKSALNLKTAIKKL